MIDIELPESASLLQTHGVCQQVTEILKRHEPIQSAAVFTGGTAPRFFITVSPKENAPYLAQVLVVTKHDDDVPPLIAKLRAELGKCRSGKVKSLTSGNISATTAAVSSVELSTTMISHSSRRL